MIGVPSSGARTARLEVLGRWTRRGSAALADQGLFAATNFVLNVLLARWLAPEAYGAFSVLFAAFLLTGTLHTALLTEPMLVFGPGKYRDELSAYLQILVRLHWRGSALVAGGFVVMACVTALAGGSDLALPALAMAFAGPLVLLTWLVRRACYARLRPEDAVVAGLVYMGSLLGLVLLLRRVDMLHPTSAVLVLGLASIGALAVLLPRLGVTVRGRADPVDEADVVRDHWHYGRWALGTAFASWIPANLLLFVLPLRGGLEAAGAFRALVNLLVPMMQVTSALGILILPVLVGSRARPASFHRYVRRLAAAFGVGAILYGLVIAGWGTRILAWLYAGAYTEHAPTLLPLALVPVFAAIAAVLGSGLRALERPDLVFHAYLLTAVVTATAGVGLTLFMGVAGAGFGWLAAYATVATALVTAYMLRGRVPSEPRGRVHDRG